MQKQSGRQAEGLPQRPSSPAQQQPCSGAKVILVLERQGPAQAASLPSAQPRHEPAAPEGGAGPEHREALCAAPLAERFGRSVPPSSQSDQPQPRCRRVDAPQREHLLGQLLPRAAGRPGRHATRHLPAAHRQRCGGSNRARSLQTLSAGGASAAEPGAGEADFL